MICILLSLWKIKNFSKFLFLAASLVLLFLPGFLLFILVSLLSYRAAIMDLEGRGLIASWKCTEE